MPSIDLLYIQIHDTIRSNHVILSGLIAAPHSIIFNYTLPNATFTEPIGAFLYYPSEFGT